MLNLDLLHFEDLKVWGGRRGMENGKEEGRLRREKGIRKGDGR